MTTTLITLSFRAQTGQAISVPKITSFHATVSRCVLSVTAAMENRPALAPSSRFEIGGISEKQNQLGNT